MNPKECKLLIPDLITKEGLRELLADNELGQYDPIKEAFKVYDPHNTGYVDSETLRRIFQDLGYGTIDDDDLLILVETADADRDGKISLEDFRSMLSSPPPKK